MLIDTNLSYSRHEVASAFLELRKCYYASDEVYKYKILKAPSTPMVTYYLNAEMLLRRICEIAGINYNAFIHDKRHILKPIAWSILSSYGHPAREIKKLFGQSSATGGLNTYYRKALVYHMKSKPFYLKQYDDIVKVLDADIEEIL